MRNIVLVVDDSVDELTMISETLEGAGTTTLVARDGQSALAIVDRVTPDAILMDAVMPGMDGFETAAHIKRRARTHDVPIIFLTAAGAEPDHAFRGYAAGAVDYIAKPFDPWVLRAKVAVFVDLYMKNRQLREQADLLRRQAESSPDGASGGLSGLLTELSRRLSAVEVAAAGLASLPTVKADSALADGLAQLDRGIGRLRDTLDALGADG